MSFFIFALFSHGPKKPVIKRTNWLQVKPDTYLDSKLKVCILLNRGVDLAKFVCTLLADVPPVRKRPSEKRELKKTSTWVEASLSLLQMTTLRSCEHEAMTDLPSVPPREGAQATSLTQSEWPSIRDSSTQPDVSSQRQACSKAKESYTTLQSMLNAKLY